MIEADSGLLRPRHALIAFEAGEIDLDGPMPEPVVEASPEVAAVVCAAVLTATAFRLRDEAGLIVALRELTRAVASLDGQR